MIDYSTWPERKLSVTSLKLDNENPRIPGDNKEVTQREIIHDLILHDKVYELAKNITEQGYFPVELLVAIKDGDKYVVIEGNRRLTALKVLIRPALSPKTDQNRFKMLSALVDVKRIAKVRVIIAPSRAAAAPLIMSKHTLNMIEKWDPLMQSTYYESLLAGNSFDDISSLYNLSNSKLKSAIYRNKLYKLVCMLNLDETILEKVKNPRAFHITNLERIVLNNKGARDLLNIELLDNGDIQLDFDNEDFRKILKRIVTDVATQKSASREWENDKKISDYLNRIQSELNANKVKSTEKKSTSEIFRAADNENKSPEQEKASKPKTLNKKPTRKPIKSISMLPNSLQCDVNHQRIIDIFNELKRLPVAKFPNASAVLFRCLVEMSISRYLSESGHIESMKQEMIRKITEKAARKGNQPDIPKEWYPSLAAMINYLHGEDSPIENSKIKDSIRAFAQSTGSVSLKILNKIIHNEHYHPTEEDLRNMGKQLESLLAIVLTDPISTEV